MQAKTFMAFLAVVLIVTLTGCGSCNYVMGQTIRPGMTLGQVHHRMGKPDVGFGLPQKGEGQSFLSYKIPFNKYLVVNFDGDKVGDPPIEIESRRGFLVY